MRTQQPLQRLRFVSMGFFHEFHAAFSGSGSAKPLSVGTASLHSMACVFPLVLLFHGVLRKIIRLKASKLGRVDLMGGQKRDPAETEELLVAPNLLLIEEVLHQSEMY